MRLESLALSTKRLENRRRTVGEGKRPGQDLNDWSAARHLDRRRFVHRRAAITRRHRVAARPFRSDREARLHAEFLVRVLAHRAVHVVGAWCERERQRGARARLDDFGFLFDALSFDFQCVRNATDVSDREDHDSGSDTVLRELDLPLGEPGGHGERMRLPGERDRDETCIGEVSERNSKSAQHTGSSSGKCVLTACSMPETPSDASLFRRE